MIHFKRVLKYFWAFICDSFNTRVVKGSSIKYWYRRFLEFCSLSGILSESLLVRVAPRGEVVISNQEGLFHVRLFSNDIRLVSSYYECGLVEQIPAGKNRLFIDIGSYIGLYVIRAVNRGYHVHSFEPVKTTFSLLQKNVSLNKCHDVILLNNLAVSDTKGSVSIVEQEFFAGRNKISDNGYQVSCIRFDDYISNSNINATEIGYMKIDVEGHGLSVLSSMRNCLDNLVDGTRLQIEILDADPQEDAIYSFLQQNSFCLIYREEKDCVFEKRSAT